jgi:hypothetical protein
MGRTAMAVVAAAVVTMALGCAVTEKQRLETEHEEKISAARMSGKLRHDDPLVVMLSPDEREALGRAGMLEEPHEGDVAADAADPNGDPDEVDEDGKPRTTADKAGDVAIAVMSVVVPLGMAIAPYFLF